MILTIHMKSGKTIMIPNPGEALVDFIAQNIGKPERMVVRTINTTTSCDRIHVKGSNYRNNEAFEVHVVVSEIEFVQFDAPTSEAVR